MNEACDKKCQICGHIEENTIRIDCPECINKPENMLEMSTGIMKPIENEFNKQLNKTRIKLADLSEAFIIDQIGPFLKDETLTESLRVRIKDNKTAVNEYKDATRKTIDRRIEANSKVKSLSIARERNDALRCLKKELNLND